MRDNLYNRFQNTARVSTLGNNFSHDVNRSEQWYVEPATRIANMLERTLARVNESSFNNENSMQYVNRMTAAKYLPLFSDDPFDRVGIEQAFDLSTELGKYPDRENVARLFEALRGKAHEATKASFASGNTTHENMSSLEMR